MPALDPKDVELLVYTYKEGLLSKVAHDLKLRAQRIQLDLDEDHVDLRVEVRGLRVINAMQNGRVAPELLSSKDKMKIEDTLYSKDVLHAAAHPHVTFESSAVTAVEDGYEVRGRLTIRGRTAEVRADVLRRDGRLSTRVKLLQTDFGITPFSALLGALKVKPEVLVQLSVPDPAGASS